QPVGSAELRLDGVRRFRIETELVKGGGSIGVIQGAGVPAAMVLDEDRRTRLAVGEGGAAAVAPAVLPNRHRREDLVIFLIRQHAGAVVIEVVRYLVEV